MQHPRCIINVCLGVAEVLVYHEVQLRPHVQDTEDHHGVSPPGEDPPGVVEDTLPGVQYPSILVYLCSLERVHVYTAGKLSLIRRSSTDTRRQRRRSSRGTPCISRQIIR